MVTNNNNQVNLEQVCSLNIEQSRLLQYAISPTPTLRSVAKNQDGDILGTKRGISIVSYHILRYYMVLHGTIVGSAVRDVSRKTPIYW